jgi:hypothetical protein
VDVGLDLGLQFFRDLFRLHVVVLGGVSRALGQYVILRLALCAPAAVKPDISALEFYM